MAKTRLDVALVERGLAETRAAAQRLVMAGLVFSGERRLDKPGQAVAADTPIEVRGQPHPYVSRGGLKLEKALDHFAIPVAGRIALDVGASTGGFTDLPAAARRGQGLCHRCRHQPARLEAAHRSARDLDGEDQHPRGHARAGARADRPDRLRCLVHRPAHGAAGGAGPGGARRASRGADQAAVRGRQGPGRARAASCAMPALHEEVCETIADWLAAQPGWSVLGVTESPIEGAEGNKEFLIAGSSVAVQRIARVRDPELVVVGQRLERREVGLQQRLVGQAAIGDHVEAAAGPERTRRGSDHVLAKSRFGGAAGMEGRIADDRVVGRRSRFLGKVEPMERGARVGDVGACRFDGAMLGVDQVDLRDARRARERFARQVAPAAAEIGDVAREVVGQMRRPAAPSRRRRDPRRRCRAG